MSDNTYIDATKFDAVLARLKESSRRGGYTAIEEQFQVSLIMCLGCARVVAGLPSESGIHVISLFHHIHCTELLLHYCCTLPCSCWTNCPGNLPGKMIYLPRNTWRTTDMKQDIPVCTIMV